MADISIFTETDEVRLQYVFERMREELGDNDAPSGKSKPEVLKEFFGKVLPDYDRDRFYASHMKKVVEWYSCLKENASVDFVQEEEEQQEEA